MLTALVFGLMLAALSIGCWVVASLLCGVYEEKGASMFFRNPIERFVREEVSKSMETATRRVSEALSGYRAVDDLQKQLTAMEIQRDKKQEEWDRREREIEHKVGLERKRQEFEIAQTKRETTVAVREENLTADKERFKNEMEFQRKHLQSEIDRLSTIVGQMLERIPSAEIFADLTNAGGRKR